MSNSIVQFLRGQFQMAHGWLGDTAKGVSDEQAHWQPQGKVNPIGAQLVHVVLTEDMLASAAGKRQPLAMSSWAGKAGFSEPPPAGGSWGEWAHRVKIDVDAVQAYTQAVWANTDAILAEMSDADLNSPFDLSAVGIPNATVGTVLNLLILNVYSHTGEISAIKGLQGLQGYPG